jgi:hypothetical protein
MRQLGKERSEKMGAFGTCATKFLASDGWLMA